MISNKNSVVGIFESHERVEDAIRELQKSGFDMKKLSIIGKDYHTEENVVGYYTSGDRMKYWGKLGAFWGGFWGLLFGSAFFWVPGIGPLLVAGPIAASIVGALEGAVMTGGLTALGAGLYSVGIPKEQCAAIRNRVEERQTPPGGSRDPRASGTRQRRPGSDWGKFRDRPLRKAGRRWRIARRQFCHRRFRSVFGWHD